MIIFENGSENGLSSFKWLDILDKTRLGGFSGNGIENGELSFSVAYD